MKYLFLLTYFIISFLPAFAGGSAYSLSDPDAKPNSFKKSILKSVLSEGNWYKMRIKETGVYKISGIDLENAGISIATLPIKNIAIYGNQTGMVPENNAVNWDTDLKEFSIAITDHNSNGLFDKDDYFLFYAESPHHWVYDKTTGLYTRDRHLYSSVNNYYLSVDESNSNAKHIGKRAVSSEIPNKEVYSFLDYQIYEKELINPNNYGRDWYGEGFTAGSKKLPIIFETSHLIKDSLVKYSFSVANSKLASSVFTITSGDYKEELEVNSSKYCDYKRGTINKSFSSKEDQKLTFNIQYTTIDEKSQGWLKKLEINCWRKLMATGGQMSFRNPSVVGVGNVARYHMGKSGNIRTTIWDVSDPVNVTEVHYTEEGEMSSFITSAEENKEFMVFNHTVFFVPECIEKIENQNLHGSPLTNYVIITHPLFKEEAERLARIHREHSQIHVTVVTSEQVYNEFSTGKQDAMAIRRFAKMFYDRTHNLPESLKQSVPNLRYLLLFGDGTCDNKNILGNGGNFIVSFYRGTISEEIIDQSFSVADECFGYLEDHAVGNTGDNLNISIGRFPVNTPDEAKIIVNKVEAYITRSDVDKKMTSPDWRNCISLIADDADISSDMLFLYDLEELSKKINESVPSINLDKIYADTYKQEISSGRASYPDVNKLIQKRMNSGALLVNYMGHGAKSHLGLERYMTPSDILGYTNQHALPVFITTTCDFGIFDLMSEKSGAESLLLNPVGGSIAVLSAARAIQAYEDFNTSMVVSCLQSENGELNSIGDALRIAKNARKRSNNAATNLLGDPALKISMPQNKVLATKINSHEITYTGNEASTIDDTLKALSEVTIEGIIADAENNRLQDFNGKVYLVVLDKPQKTRTLANDKGAIDTSYFMQKSRLFQGITDVTEGTFSFSFLVPLNIAYHFDYGKMSFYAYNKENNASGMYNQIMIGGVDEDAHIEGVHSRPQIALFINDTTFLNGGMTNENPVLLAHLSDKFGINISDGGESNRNIEAILDHNPNKIFTLNDFYEQDLEDVRKGVVRYPLHKLSKGKHTLTLRAWNIYNLSEAVSIDFVVNDSKEFELGKVYNYPNPFTSETRFVCELNDPESVQHAEIHIYDMQGRKIEVLYPSIHSQAHSITYNWNGKLKSGQTIHTGIYIYNYVIQTITGEKKTQKNKCIYINP